MKYVLTYQIRCGSVELAEAASACVDNVVVALGQFARIDQSSSMPGDELKGELRLYSSYALEPGWIDKSFEALVSMGLGHSTVMIESNTHEAKEEETAS